MSERMLSRWLRSLNTILFQSLIGSLNNCNPAAAITYRSNTVYKFQSLIGSLSNCNRWHLKGLLYLVFKVQLRG